MSTERQKKLAREIAGNILRDKPKNKQELLISADYAPGTVEGSTTRTIAQPGVQKELVNLGFSIENAKRVVGAILNSPTVYEMVTPDNQLRAAQEVFKVTGEYAAEKHINVNIPVPLLGGDSVKKQ